MIEIAPYCPEMKPDIVRLLGDIPHKSLIWEWQFEQSPFVDSFKPVVAVDDGVVIGFNGVMPFKAVYRGKEIDALWSCDFYVNSQYRGHGLGKLIKEELITHCPLIMSFGISPIAASVLLKMGWLSSPEVFNFRRINRINEFKGALFVILQKLNRIRGFFRSVSKDLVVSNSSELPPISVVDALWKKVFSSYEKIVVRDWQYLNWKYQNHPLAKYQFLLVKEKGELRALGVIREHSGTVRLVDYLGASDDYLAARAVCEELVRRYGQSSNLACTTSGKSLQRALQDCGFFSPRTQPRFFVRSSLTGDSNCELGWFIMGGDSDGELLLAATESMNTKGLK